MFDFGFQLESRVHAHTVNSKQPQSRLAQDIPEPNLCVSRGMSLLKVLNEACEAHYVI